MTDFVYLDNAATTFPKPPEVIRFMCDFYAVRGVNPGRTGFDLALEAEETLATADRRLCEVLRRHEPRSAGVLLQRHRRAQPADLERAVPRRPRHHHLPRAQLGAAAHVPHAGLGVEVDFVPFDDAGYVDPGDIARRIRPTTKLVVVNHGSNVIGTIQPVAEVGASAASAGSCSPSTPPRPPGWWRSTSAP
jgi:cysteine desulfurase / selenocysteine lyase